MKKSDITNHNDIEKLVNSFYEKVNVDPVLSPFFQHVRWDKHLPIMYKFWENVLFYTGDYSGNPMLQHQLLHIKKHLTENHFSRWITTFCSVVDENFKGTQATLIKERAKSITQIMIIKILNQDLLPITKKL
ncbi:MAG: group III truncated hemoglobin [Saprospiraceae bacterium]